MDSVNQSSNVHKRSRSGASLRTGSLSAVLWLQAARTLDAHTSIATYSRLGLMLVPAKLAGTLATPLLRH